MDSARLLPDRLPPTRSSPDRLTAYAGDATDLPAGVLQGFLNAVSLGTATVPIDRTFTIDQIVEAHAIMESGQAAGKLVITT